LSPEVFQRSISINKDIRWLPPYFKTEDCVNLVVSSQINTSRGHAARNLQNTERIIRAFEQKPETSIRIIAREYDLSYSTIQRILKKEKLHAFHCILVQRLREEDYLLRRRFCENFLRKVDRDSRFPSRVIFSDEPLFIREGILNFHNMHL